MLGIRSATETYIEVQTVGKHKAKKLFVTTLSNGILAGIFIALGAFAAASGSYAIDNVSVAKIIAGTIFPIGLILTILCGAELFTGNILLCVAVFERKITVKNMFSNWTIVYIGNFIGAIVIALLIYMSGMIHSADGIFGGYVLKVAATKVNLTFTQAFIRGILCNILVCMAVWASYTATSVVGKILTIELTVMTFIISGFEHSIANMYYLGVGFLGRNNALWMSHSHQSGEALSHLNLAGILHNLVPVTLGNIVGGLCFVGVLYWLSNRSSSRFYF